MDEWVVVGSEFPVTCLGKKFYGTVIAMGEDGVDIRLESTSIYNRN